MLKRSTALLAMLLLAAVVPLTAQREIRGRVTSSTAGAPLSGVNILVVGTNTGTLTDTNGNFTLSVPSGPARVRASLIGYKSDEAVVPTGQQTVNFALQEDVLNLEGVVVTGQATSVARRNLANAVATVSAEQLNQAPSQSVEQALAGKIAGANISSNSGAPGGGMQVDLRGVSSINAASAAAIYGSQASNGVIIVTTKGGRAGAPQLSESQRLGYYQLSNKFEMRQWTRDAAVAAFGADAAQYFNADGSPRQAFDLEELLAGREDLSRETSLSVRGGTEGGTRYYLSGQVQDDAGIIENTGFERQSIRLNLDQTFGDRVETGVNLNLIHTLASRGLTNNDNTGTSFYMVFPFTPNFVDLRRQADGTYPANPYERSNPLQTAALMANEEDVWRFIAAGNVAVGLMEGETQSLNLRLNGGADYFAQNNSLFFPPELQFEPNDQEPGTSLLTNADNLNLTGNLSLVHLFSPAGAGWSATTSGGVQYSDQDLSIVRNVGRDAPLSRGGYHTFSTGSGETSNDLIAVTIYAHPSIRTDAQRQSSGELDRRVLAKTGPAATPGRQAGIGSDLVFTIYRSNTDPLPIVRNEELLLLRAEARWFTGDRAGALADLNLVRTQSGGLAPIAMPASDAAFVDALLYERRYSLLFEGGHRWIDARRLNRLNQLPRDLPTHLVHARFPVPEAECLARGATGECSAGS